MKLLVGIVTYKPNKERLAECLASVQGQDVHIVDNTENNIGIAAALGQIMDYAAETGYDWVLTLDQDSIVLPGLIEAYEKAMEPDVGAMTCVIRDRNFEEEQETGDVDWCITSGCLMRVDAYRKTAGYDGSLFIDMVDQDICYSLKEAGYRIVCVPHVGLLHEVGHGRKTPIGYSYNEPAWRDYYMARNRIIVARKHGKSLLEVRLKNIRDMGIAALYEDNKMAKIREYARGWRDGENWR